jgi:hypothetical protein
MEFATAPAPALRAGGTVLPLALIAKRTSSDAFVDLLGKGVPDSMSLPVKVVSGGAAAVLDELTAGLDVGDSRKIDHGRGYMPVHVECLHRSGLGPLFSVAHYYESQGDLVPDPDVVFARTATGWAPVSFQNSIAYRAAVRFDSDGTIEVDEVEQADLVSFSVLFLRNISVQQGLSLRKPR